MPLVRIDINKSASKQQISTISSVIYNAMVGEANVPLHDKFQIVTRHSDDELVYPEEGYLGIGYTSEIVMIQITWLRGRSIEVKKNFFRKIAHEIHELAGIRKEDIWISLVEANPEDWSFGNGEMQYAPAVNGPKD
jgi:4-oxalocrotonate tautomerase